MAQIFHIGSAGSNVLQTSGGATLHTVTVNTAIGTSLTLYDGTDDTGPEIAVYAAASPGSFLYDAPLNNGLFAVLVGTGDVTITLQ